MFWVSFWILRLGKIQLVVLWVEGRAVMFLRFGGFLAVETCSKAILALWLGYGKSPCFSRVAFLWLVGPDYPLLVCSCVDGVDFLECAF
jgi:hypothetical protein